MTAVQVRTRIVYWAPTAKRHYQSKRAAANSEARALIAARYPTEKEEYERGLVVSPGYHWSSDERLVKLHKRLSRLILRQLRNQSKD